MYLCLSIFVLYLYLYLYCTDYLEVLSFWLYIILSFIHMSYLFRDFANRRRKGLPDSGANLRKFAKVIIQPWTGWAMNGVDQPCETMFVLYKDIFYIIYIYILGPISSNSEFQHEALAAMDGRNPFSTLGDESLGYETIHDSTESLSKWDHPWSSK